MNLNETYAQIEALLEAEEHPQTLTVAAREARRTQIEQQIRSLTGHITKLNNRFRQLPELPPVYDIEWAQAVMQFPNLVFVVLETTGIATDADILRVLIVDQDGDTVFDSLVKPGRQVGFANTPYTGILPEQIESAPTLADIWVELRTELTGCFVLAFNLSFVTERLRENAEHYHLAPMMVIGADLQEKARSYWNSYYPPKLVDLCKRIGHTLPKPATAPARASGQRAILEAMSRGITDGGPVLPVEQVDLDNPF